MRKCHCDRASLEKTKGASHFGRKTKEVKKLEKCPLLQKCCLCLSANESFFQAEQDLFLLTGMKVGHSTLQRQVHTEIEHLEFPVRIWKGKVSQAIALFKKECPKRARKFLANERKTSSSSTQL